MVKLLLVVPVAIVNHIKKRGYGVGKKTMGELLRDRRFVRRQDAISKWVHFGKATVKGKK